MSDDKQRSESTAPPVKRSYTRPQLVEYGPISKLTRSGGRTRNEPAAPLMRFMA